MAKKMQEKKEEKTLSEEQLFKEEKTKLYRGISEYYGIDATTNKEIRERLSYFKQALDDFGLCDFKKIKEKISVPNDANADQRFMLQISFSVYYPAWVFFGQKKGAEMVKRPNFPAIQITNENKNDGVFENKIVKGNWKNYDVSSQKNPILLINFIMHETIHSLGYATEKKGNDTWNEFAVGLFLPFFLPIHEKENKRYSDFYFGFRNPFHVSENMKGTFLLGAKGKTRVSHKIFSKNKAISEYIGHEYPEFMFANLLYYKLDRKKHIEFLRKNANKKIIETVGKSYKNSIFDLDFLISGWPKKFKSLESVISALDEINDESEELNDAKNSVLAFQSFFALFEFYYSEKEMNTKEKLAVKKLKNEIERIFLSMVENNKKENREKEMKRLKNLLKKLDFEITPKNMKDFVYLKDEKENEEKNA